ncbi:hypothetical protein XA68_16984 [Ophiocordyceps unilateralis]|uniref:Uncharacterized protein n=1 Tax=Ophiocordyceps unilateralis TaxID=268505 RepID=A0A2A9PKK4_OPHUN|nr:hypothetical protein XA68_16984 [Ophiocordyceps unilateralis]
MLPARAHQPVATVKTAIEARNKGLRPTASDKRPNKGWKAVDVSKKAVDNQEAELAAPKYDVMTGCELAMMVPSKQHRKCVASTCEKMNQKRVGDVPPRKGAASSSVSVGGGSKGDDSSVSVVGSSKGDVSCPASAVGNGHGDDDDEGTIGSGAAIVTTTVVGTRSGSTIGLTVGRDRKLFGSTSAPARGFGAAKGLTIDDPSSSSSS